MRIKYLLVYLLPTTAYLSFDSVGIMTFAPVILFFVILPLIELFIKPDSKKFEHRIVKDELEQGFINPNSKEKFVTLSNALIERGAAGLVLGCTKIPLLIGQEDFDDLIVFDTTKIHVDSLIDFALNGKVANNR